MVTLTPNFGVAAKGDEAGGGGHWQQGLLSEEVLQLRGFRAWAGWDWGRNWDWEWD